MKSMNLQLAILILGIFVSTSTSAEVYKRTNPDGSFTFSDVPAKINAEPVELPPSSRYSPPSTPTFEPTISPIPKASDEKYESITITSPTHDSAVRSNAGNLTIKFKVEPGLKPGHSYALLMDGKSMGKGLSGSIQLTSLDRGSHTFTVQVVDQDKKVVVQSSAVVVHLMRAIAR